jgi:hypothetical protein
MKMDSLAPQSEQYIGAEQYQHETDDRLETECQAWPDAAANQDHGAAKQQQGKAVAHTPGGPQSGRIAQLAAVRAQAGNGCQVVGLDGVLQAQKQAEDEDTEH